jgi:hypothetical protein
MINGREEAKVLDNAIWVSKLSPNCNYLATGRQDGILRVYTIIIDKLSSTISYFF